MGSLSRSVLGCLLFTGVASAAIRVVDSSPDAARVVLEPAEVQRIIVEVDPGRAADVRRALDRGHARVASHEHEIDHVYTQVFQGLSTSVDTADLGVLRALPYVRAIHPDHEVHATAAAATPENVARVEAPKLWEAFGTRGEGIVVAVIDSGIDHRHPAFAAAGKYRGGYDYVGDDADPMDEAGHGTHVAGILAGDDGEVIGVAPGASLIAYRVLDHRGRGNTSDVLAALERALDPDQDGDRSDRVDVVNLSLGGPGNPDDPLSRAVDALTAAGVVVCVSAGNDMGRATIGSPGAARSAITVGASDDRDRPAWFMSTGPIIRTLEMKPDVLAPGVAIPSAKLGGGVVKLDGTSMAAPHVAGVAALLAGIHPDWTPAEIKAALVSTGTNIVIPTHNVAGVAGGGRIDAHAAANATVLPEPANLSFGIAGTAPYARTLTLRLHNHGGRRESLSVAVKKNMLRQRGDVTVTPSAFDLEPGQSIELSVHLSMEPVAFDQPEVPGGLLELTGTSTLHVPWGVAQGSAVTVEYAAGKDFLVWPLQDGRFVSWAMRVRGDGGTQAASMLLAARTYDFLVMAEDATLLVAEQQNVEGVSAVSFAPPDAKNTITSAAVDDLGRPLENGFCPDHLTVFLPGSKPGAQAYLDFSGKLPTVRATDVSERFTIARSRACIDVTRRTVHAIVFEPLAGIGEPVSLTNLPSDWKPKAVRLFVSPDDDQRKVNLGLRLHAENDYPWRMGAFIPIAGEVSYLPLGNGTREEVVTLFVARGSSPLLTYEPTWELISRPPEEHGRMIIRGSFLSVQDGSAAIAPVYGGEDRTFVPAEPEIHIGDGPVRPLRTIVADGYGVAGRLTLESNWVGSFNEHRYRESELGERRLFGPDGAEITPVKTDFVWNHYARSQLGQGAHRAVLVNPYYETAGLRGRATLTTTFDTRKADQTDPEITSLRVLNGKGENRSRIDRGDTVSIVFGLADYDVKLHAKGSYAPVNGDATKLFVRPHGTATWNAAPTRMIGGATAPVTGEYYQRLPRGLEWSATLQLPMGAYDLRIEGEDASGNRTELTLEPAFAVVEPQGRRRVVRP